MPERVPPTDASLAQRPEILDRIGVPPGWERSTAAGLLIVAAQSPHDAAILPDLFEQLARNLPLLQRVASGFRRQEALRTAGQIELHRVPALLNALAAAVAPPTLGLRLTTIAIALEMRGRHEAEDVAQIASAVVNADGPRARALAKELPSVTGIADLVFKYQNLRQSWTDSEKPPHRTFEVLWQRMLYDWLHGAILAAAVRGESEGIDPSATLDLDEPDASIHVPSATGVGEGDNEEGNDVGSEHYPAHKRGQPLEPEAAVGLAKANLLARRSFSQLCQRPDDIIPAPLLRDAIAATRRQAVTALASGQLEGAIDAVATQLVAVTACRVAELSRITLGNAPAVGSCVIDVDLGLFLRSELRPDGAFTPKDDDRRWLQTGGPVVTRLPRCLIEQIRKLCEIRGSMHASQPFKVIVASSSMSGSENKESLRVIHVADTLERATPGLHVGANALRARLASHLTAQFGPEAAQIALGDGFGHPTSAAYYYRSTSAVLTNACWKYAQTLYGEDSSLPNEPPSVPGHYVGSRVAVPESRLKYEGAAIEPPRTRGSSTDEVLSTWRRYAERAAAALVYATGQRINASLTAMTIDDVCPEYGLVALSDKRATLAHHVRIAALGRVAVTALGDYVGFLKRTSTIGATAAPLARDILRGAKPLFTLPTIRGCAPLNIDAFVGRLLGNLADRSNILRHHLNQCLIAAKVDPALRHQQMGWQITPATALSEASPMSAAAFSAEFSPFIDRYMDEHGWRVSHHTKGNGWEGVPMGSLRDWKAVERAHRRERSNAISALTATVMDRREEILRGKRPRLAAAISALIPGLRLSPRHWTLEHLDPTTDAPRIDRALTGAILAHALEGDASPVADMVVRAELARIFAHANMHAIARADVPAHWKFNFTSEPSPFLKGFAAAVRQAEWIRRLVRTDAEWHPPRRESSAAACRVMLGLLLFTPYRTFKLARQIMEAAPRALRSRDHPEFIRIPIGKSHVVLTGEAALLMGGWRQSEVLPPHAQVAKYLLAKLKLIVGDDTTATNILERVEALARTAGRVELSGPERAFMLNRFSLNVVDASRAVSNDDNWPLACADPTSEAKNADGRGPSYRRIKVVSASRAQVAKVTRLLNTRLKLSLPFTGRTLPKEVRGRAALVRSELDFALADAEALTVGRAVTEYARYVIARHHEKNAIENQLVTAHTYITRFAKPLAGHLQDADLATLSAEEISRAYAVVLLGKTRRKGDRTTKGNYRRQAYNALRRFHRWLREAHGIDEVEWADLAAIAGERFKGVDPGIVRPREVHKILEQLEAEADALRVDPMISPDARYEGEQRALFAVLLASSRCRPSSVHGLTFGDLHFSDAGAWVHVRRTGLYGTAKTATSLGFHPLLGGEWLRVRRRWMDWVEQARVRLGDGFLEYPIFGELSDPRERRPRARFTNRLGELLRWATGDPAAHPYWLRKTGVIAAHASLWQGGGVPTALDAQCVLSECGHVHALTALTSYLHDAAVVFAAYLHAMPHLTAKAVINLAGIKRVTVESAWQRHKGEHGSVREMSDDQRLAISLSCIGYALAAASAEHLTDPTTDASKVRELRCSDIASFVEELQRSGVVGLAAARADLTTEQSELVVAACHKWYERTGHALANEHPTRRISSPRPVAGSTQLTDVLNGVGPGAQNEWTAIADGWSLMLRRAPLRAGLPLVDSEDQSRVERLLESVGLVAIVDEKSRTLKPLRPSGQAQSHDGSGATLTLWPAMSWMLAIVWLAAEMRRTQLLR